MTQDPTVLAFSGYSGVGKSALSRAVADSLGWKRASFGGYVRFVVGSRQEPDTLDRLQEVGQRLVDEDPEGFVRGVLAYYGWQRAESLVLDGLRHEEILRVLIPLVRPARVKIVLLQIDRHERLNRLERRESEEVPDLDRLDLKPTERQAGNELLQRADLVLDGSGQLRELTDYICDWVGRGYCD